MVNDPNFIDTFKKNWNPDQGAAKLGQAFQQTINDHQAYTSSPEYKQWQADSAKTDQNQYGNTFDVNPSKDQQISFIDPNKQIVPYDPSAKNANTNTNTSVVHDPNRVNGNNLYNSMAMGVNAGNNQGSSQQVATPSLNNQSKMFKIMGDPNRPVTNQNTPLNSTKRFLF
jgi:hypothetical protein